MAVPGDAACHEVKACAAGTWGDIPVDASTVYVDQSFNGASTGSETQPFVTIGAALAVAPPQTIVAIAAGSYAETLAVQGSAVTLWGVCPSLVTISGGAPATILISGGAHGSSVRDLSVSGSAMGVAVSGAMDIVIERVRVHDTNGRGIDVEDTFGPASATINGVLVEGAGEVGIFSMNAIVDIDASVVRDTEAGAQNGRGISAQDGAQLTLSNSLVARNLSQGVYVSASNATVFTTVVRDTMEGADHSGGIAVALGSLATLSDVLVERNANYGIMVDSSEALIERAVVRDSQPTAGAFDLGPGIQIQGGDAGEPAIATVRTSLIERSRYAGVSVTGATLEMGSTLIRDSLPRISGNDYGRGVVAFFNDVSMMGVNASINDSVIDNFVEAGLSLHGTTVIMNNCAVRNGVPNANLTVGRGICAQSDDVSGTPSVLAFNDSLIENNHDIGIFVEGSDMTMFGSVVRGTLARESDGLFGDGVHVDANFSTRPATAAIEASTVRDNARVGITSRGAAVTLSNSELSCNTIPLNGQDSESLPFNITDAGGNDCTCEGNSDPCKIYSQELAPPAPVDNVE
jgi:hypothetical protein